MLNTSRAQRAYFGLILVVIGVASIDTDIGKSSAFSNQEKLLHASTEEQSTDSAPKAATEEVGAIFALLDGSMCHHRCRRDNVRRGEGYCCCFACVPNPLFTSVGSGSSRFVGITAAARCRTGSGRGQGPGNYREIESTPSKDREAHVRSCLGSYLGWRCFPNWPYDGRSQERTVLLLLSPCAVICDSCVYMYSLPT